MPRIRNVKPEFFIHEELQELEVQNPGQYIMLTFSGLWTICDKHGVFQYKPKINHLSILPFIPYDFQKTLDILERHGYFRRYEHQGEHYAIIDTFKKHQAISGKEKEGTFQYPVPVQKVPDEFQSSSTPVPDEFQSSSTPPTDDLQTALTYDFSTYDIMTNDITTKREPARDFEKPEPTKKAKTLYGTSSLVALTDAEHDELITRYGDIQTNKIIETLDAYKASKGKPYKSDAGAIRSWVLDKVKPTPIFKPPTCPRCGAEMVDGMCGSRECPSWQDEEQT